MSEVIDSFRTARPEGRGKAVTLFVLTTIGSFGKLVLIGLWLWLIYAVQKSFGGGAQPKELRWVIFAGYMVILFGLLNFVGSLLMLKRNKSGLWIYLAAQILNVATITFSMFVTAKKLEVGGIIFLGIVLVVTGVFLALYFSNMAYYDNNKTVDQSFFESEEQVVPSDEFKI